MERARRVIPRRLRRRMHAAAAAPRRLDPANRAGALVQAVMGAWLQRGFFPLPQSRCCATRDLPTLGGSVALRLQSHPLRRARFSTREAPPCRRRRRRRSITLHAPIDRTPGLARLLVQTFTAGPPTVPPAPDVIQSGVRRVVTSYRTFISFETDPP